MTYCHVSLDFTGRGRIMVGPQPDTVTCHAHNSTQTVGPEWQQTLNCGCQLTLITLEPTSPGGATPSSTQEEPAGGQAAGGEE